MSVAWRSRISDASDHAVGSRAVLRALDAVGANPYIQAAASELPPVVSEAERAWLALRESPMGPVRATVQRTAARLLTPVVQGLRVAWTGLDGIEPDREALLRLRQMDAVWVPSRAQRDALLGMDLEPERVLVVPEPVDLGIVRPDTAPFRAPGAHGTVFLAACGTSPADGADLLVTAWASAFAPGDDVTLVIVPGAGERPCAPRALVEHLMASLAAAGLDPDAMADLVVLDEALSDRRLAGVLAGADVVVMPARAAGLERRLADARAAGRPVVGAAAHGVDAATGWPVEAARVAVGGHAEHHREIAGAHWWVQDPEALAAAMVAARCDAAGRAARGAAALRLAASHGHAVVADLALAHLASTEPMARRSRVRLGLTRVVLEGPVLDPSPLAGLNRDLIRALASGWELDLSVVETGPAAAEPLPPDDDPLVRSMAHVPAGAPHVVLRSQQPPDLTPHSGGALVQFLHWEFGALPREWRAGAALADEIWVPSGEARDALIADGVDPDRVTEIPAGVDTARFTPGAPEMDLGDAAPGLRFLHVGGLGWCGGTDLLLEAYARAFTAADEVTLVLNDHGDGRGPTPGPEADRAARMSSDVRGPRVLLLTRHLPEHVLPGLYRACDCLVHPYRVDAFGRTMLEAMACGLTVIGPDHGAAGALLLPDAAIPLTAHPVTVPVDRLAPWTTSRPPVAGEVHVDDLAAAMRGAYEDAEGRARRAARAVEVASARTWIRAAGIAADRLRILAATPRRAAA